MNYRHAFHAGNFADLVKHAALTRLLARLLAEPGALTVVDTHAGAGRYDLGDSAQARSREAEAGVARLADADLPAQFDALAAALRRLNGEGPVRTYPGSPLLIAEAVRPQDRYIGCELRPDDHGRLGAVLKATGKRASARLTDGYDCAAAVASETPDRLFVLIDPPFERPDDYVRIADTVEAVLKARPRACLLIWLPLKDLETLDAFVRRLEALQLPEVLIGEARLRRLDNPMKMNGCVLVAIGAPEPFAAELEAICAWVVSHLGEAAGQAKLWRIPAAG